MGSNDRPRAIADVSAGTIFATVTIGVPPERVFHALTAEDQIPLWWGSDAMYRTTKHTADVRPGGAWYSEGKAPTAMTSMCRASISRSSRRAAW